LHCLFFLPALLRGVQEIGRAGEPSGVILLGELPFTEGKRGAFRPSARPDAYLLGERLVTPDGLAALLGPPRLAAPWRVGTKYFRESGGVVMIAIGSWNKPQPGGTNSGFLAAEYWTDASRMNYDG
jgi:hypothetical protein